MKHFAGPAFWKAYDALSVEARELADKNFELLKANPRHPSLRLKRAGNYWSARIGSDYRALARDVEGGLLWFWIGPHDEYERIIG